MYGKIWQCPPGVYHTGVSWQLVLLVKFFSPSTSQEIESPQILKNNHHQPQHISPDAANEHSSAERSLITHNLCWIALGVVHFLIQVGKALLNPFSIRETRVQQPLLVLMPIFCWKLAAFSSCPSPPCQSSAASNPGCGWVITLGKTTAPQSLTFVASRNIWGGKGLSLPYNKHGHAWHSRT